MMARSERAKELAQQQKAEAKAMREKKRNSDNPRDWSTWRQIRESFRITHEVDPKLPWWLAGTWLGSTLVGLVLGLTMGRSGTLDWLFGLIAGALFGISAALFVLTQRTKRGTFTRYKGTPGAGEVPLSMLNKKKWTIQPAIAVTRQQDSIHRAIGEAGLILVADGDPGRLKPLLATELKRHQQVLYGIHVEAIQMGDDPGQVPMEKLQKHIEKLPKTLDAVELEEVKGRLKALDAMRSRVPLPKGPLPTSTKGSRKAMRGR